MPYDDAMASIYDVIYQSKKNYAQEAEHAHRIIGKYRLSTGCKLLDVACGTGGHAQYFMQWYDVEGIDSSEAQLAIARQRLPDVLFRRANMTRFELKKSYDAVTCLFNSIAHVLTLESLAQAITAMARHLKQGGILLVEPWIGPGAFIGGSFNVDAVELENTKVVRVTRAVRDGRIVRFALTHFVSRNGLYEEPFTVRQESALYTLDEYRDTFHSAGLVVFYDEPGLTGRRGVIVGRKQV